MPGGRTSTTRAFSAVPAPLLRAVIVYVSVSPANAGSWPSAFETSSMSAVETVKSRVAGVGSVFDPMLPRTRNV